MNDGASSDPTKTSLFQGCANGCGCLVIAVIGVLLFIGQMVLLGAFFWHFLGW